MFLGGGAIDCIQLMERFCLEGYDRLQIQFLYLGCITAGNVILERCYINRAHIHLHILCMKRTLITSMILWEIHWERASYSVVLDTQSQRLIPWRAYFSADEQWWSTKCPHEGPEGMNTLKQIMTFCLYFIVKRIWKHFCHVLMNKAWSSMPCCSISNCSRWMNDWGRKWMNEWRVEETNSFMNK